MSHTDVRARMAPCLMASMLLALAAPGGAGAAQPETGQEAKTGAHEFITEAAQGGQMEVELGRLATKHASNGRVKQFGQRMVTDHGKANTQLKQLAAKKQVKLPAKLSAEQRAEVARLSKLHGAEFDREYMQTMVQDHEKDVATFRQEASSAGDADVKAFAQKTLPTLETHLRLAQDIASSTGGATSGASSHH